MEKKVKICWEDLEWRNQIIMARKLRSNTPEAREQRRQAALNNWQREEYRHNHQAAMKLVRSAPEWLEGNRKRMQDRWHDPTERQKILDSRGEVTQELREIRSKNTSAANKVTWADPDVRAKRIATLKATLKRKKAERLKASPPEQN